MLKLLFGLAIAVILVGGAAAQPADTAEQQERAVGPYLYLTDSNGNKVLLSTQFWRNDPKYDDRAFHRFLDVMAALEKRGFRKNDKAVIDWDKPEPVVRCYIYLEDLQTAKKAKGAPVSDTRLWCAENGASDHEVRPSDTPKHVDEVMKYFDEYFARANAKVHKKSASG